MEGKLMLSYKRIPYKAITVKGSMITAKQKISNHTITRNCSFFKLIDPIKSRRSSKYDSNDDFYFSYDDNNDIENNMTLVIAYIHFAHDDNQHISKILFKLKCVKFF